MKHIIFTSFIFSLYLQEAHSQELPDAIEIHERASINWTQMRLEGSGTLPLPSDAYSKQELRAQSLAADALEYSYEYFYLNKNTQIKDICDDPNTKRHVKAVQEKYQVAETEYRENDELSSSVYLDIHTLIRPYLLELASSDDPLPLPKSNTGIIIDARNIEYDPVLFPTIEKGNDQNWLSVSLFSYKQARTKLPFVYATTAAHPISVARAGKKPAIFIAKSSIDDHILLDDNTPNGLSDEAARALMSRGNIVILISTKE